MQAISFAASKVSRETFLSPVLLSPSVKVSRMAIRAVSSFSEPIVSGSTPVYTAIVSDADGFPLRNTDFTTLTLSIINTKTGAIVNGVDTQNILNTDRGVFGDDGSLIITLLPGDTFAPDGDVDRSLVFQWSFGDDGIFIGRHQMNFHIIALAGDGA